MPPKFSDHGWAKDTGVPWKARVCRASAPDPALFPLVAAVTGVLSAIPLGMPRYHLPGMIDGAGTVACRTMDGQGNASRDYRVIGNVITVRDYLRQLADHCRLSDEDRIAFFDEFKKGFKDLRAQSGLDVKRHN